ncbi:hypothetical protein BHE74_00020917 [Ensete ventricosum]|nr:hypothetical protein BHE74_00020917 [Ensete ventricosum]
MKGNKFTFSCSGKADMRLKSGASYSSMDGVGVGREVPARDAMAGGLHAPARSEDALPSPPPFPSLPLLATVFSMRSASEFAEQALAGSGPCALARPWSSRYGVGARPDVSAVRPLAPPVYPAGYLRRVDHVGGPAVRGYDDLAAVRGCDDLAVIHGASDAVALAEVGRASRAKGSPGKGIGE